jgi:hypothetical protein
MDVFLVCSACAVTTMIPEFTEGWPQGYIFAQFVAKCFMGNKFIVCGPCDPCFYLSCLQFSQMNVHTTKMQESPHSTVPSVSRLYTQGSMINCIQIIFLPWVLLKFYMLLRSKVKHASVTEEPDYSRFHQT